MAVFEAPRMGKSVPDELLLAGFLARRDEAAFEQLVRRHGPTVLRTCRDILGDASAAEDAFQATFLVLIRQAGAIRRRDRLGPWLHEVARRLARRARGGEWRRREQERGAAAMAMARATGPDRDPGDLEGGTILHEEIGQLPPKLRDAVIACYLEGLTVEEAARRLDCPSGTLKSRLVKARDLLRSRLARRGLAASVALFLLLRAEGRSAAATVDEAMLRATIRTTLGDPDAVAGPVASLAETASPARVAGARSGPRPPTRRAWVLALLTLALVGGVPWALVPSSWAATPGAIARSGHAGLVALLRSVGLARNLDAAPASCH